MCSRTCCAADIVAEGIILVVQQQLVPFLLASSSLAKYPLKFGRSFRVQRWVLILVHFQHFPIHQEFS